MSLNSIFRKKIEALKEFGLVEEDDTEIRLTPVGAFFADEVAEQFHSREYTPFPLDLYEPGPLHPAKDNEP
jgi:oxygen-independent coproporphyrinogen III oxidase